MLESIFTFDHILDCSGYSAITPIVEVKPVRMKTEELSTSVAKGRWLRGWWSKLGLGKPELLESICFELSTWKALADAN